MNNSLLTFPSQKKSINDKTEKWAQDCIEAAENITAFRDYRIRESQYNKQINYNLANDILDTRDIENVVNPLGIRGATFPAKMQNYPLLNPKIDLLVGEEAKRRFNWFVRVTNPDAITEKENNKKKLVFDAITAEIIAGNTDQAEIQKRMMKLDKYLKYEYQELKELTDTRILDYLYKNQNLKVKFNSGFHDALISSEEIYIADIVSGEPILRKGNPLNFFTIRSGESNYIEDSDIIIEEIFMSPGQIIDSYYDHLTDSQVTQIEEGSLANKSAVNVLNHRAMNSNIRIDDFLLQNGANNLIEVDSRFSSYFAGSYDTEGNIRVLRVLWKSKKKVGILSYIDEFGDIVEDIVDETYKKASNEVIKWVWINEWWEGTKIADDIFIKMQPRPVQFRKIDNISYCNPGIVGTYYNINDSKAKSLMDKGKPYQYLYNIFMYRTELAFAKSKGKIAELDVSKIPDDWTLDKWMYYAEIMGWAAVDPFNEGKKGQAKGKLAGSFNTTGKVLDMEMGNYIQSHIQMLQYIESQVGKIVGVSEQRQGQIDTQELVGNVERAVTQSSHITEKWFMLHDNTKLRAMEILMETAKQAWKGKPKKLQYIMDDMSTMIIEVDEGFAEREHGIFISDSTADTELFQTIKSLSQAALQNDKLTMSSLVDVYMSSNISSMRRKLEAAEDAKFQQQQELQKQQEQAQLQAQQMAQQAATEAQQLEMDRMILDGDIKIKIAEINNQAKLDAIALQSALEKPEDDNSDIENKKLNQEKEQFKEEIALAKKELEENVKLKKQELEIKKQDLEVKRKQAASKAKQASKK